MSSVPQGGWYDVQVRESNETGVYANGSNAWGVGIIIGLWGQSNAVWMAESIDDGYAWGGSDYTANALLKQYGGMECDCNGVCNSNTPATGSWVTPISNAGVTLGNNLVSSLNIPIGFVGYGLSGSVLLQADAGSACQSSWYWLGTIPKYTLAKNNMQTVIGSGISPEFIVWWQGWSDGYAGVSQADYYAGLQTLVNNVDSDFPGTKVLWVYNDNSSTNVKNAFLQAIAAGVGYAGADATGLIYPNYPDIGPSDATTIAEQLATNILAMQPKGWRRLLLKWLNI